MKYNFTDGTFAIEVNEKVFNRIIKEHPFLRHRSMPKDISEKFFLYHKDFLSVFEKEELMHPTITAEEYLSQFDNILHFLKPKNKKLKELHEALLSKSLTRYEQGAKDVLDYYFENV